MGWRVSDVLQAKGRVFTCRMSWLLKTLLGSGHPCLFVGESGTSKSVTIASYLSGLDSSHLTLNMNFSSRTSSLDVQHAIEDSIEKRTKVWGLTGPVMWACASCQAQLMHKGLASETC